MADTSVGTNVEVTQWERDFFSEYVRSNQFAEYTGTGTSNVVVANERLSNNPGDNVTITLIGALGNSAVTGDDTLEGNEEALDNYGHIVNCDYRRNAVRVTKAEQAKSPIELLDGARDQLMAWAMDDLRDRIIAQLGSIDGVLYGSATEGNKDTWAAANSDRVLYGGATANHSGDNSADLAKVDNTNDKLTTTSLSLLKRMAKAASPRIRPFRVRDNMREEWFVVFAASEAFRDFRQSLESSSSQGALFQIYQAGENHPLVRDGDVVFDGCIVREVPEISVLSGVGDSSIDVAPVYLCGAQAIGFGIKQRSRAIFDQFDYGMKRGVGVEECTGVEKLQSNFGTLKDHGVATGFFAGVGD